jgi:competence protein ComEC
MSTLCNENVIVYFFDVGQGDSILVKTSNKAVLIDGGPSSAGSTLLGYLSTYQIQKIDLLFATHPHEDHIGGLVSVLQSTIAVTDVVYNGVNYTTPVYNDFETLASMHNLIVASRNQIYSLTPTINFTVLSPTNPPQFGQSALNENSIVLKLQVAETSILLTGDATTETEDNMMAAGLNLDSLVLKVGHHGSNSSTSQAFLGAVTPSYAVICVGANNGYGHPTQQTLDRLAANQIATFRTDTNGTIILQLNASASPSPTPIVAEFPSLTLIIVFIATSTTLLLKLKRENPAILFYC